MDLIEIENTFSSFGHLWDKRIAQDGTTQQDVTKCDQRPKQKDKSHLL